MSKALIIGSTGTVGSTLANILREQGFELALATSQIPQSSDQVQINLVNQEGLEAAFLGVTHAFFMSPPGYANQDELLIPLIEAAHKYKLEKVVLMTALGVDMNPESPFRKAEIVLENTGLNYNIIRPNWFLQNFNTFWIEGILKSQKIFLPVGQAKGSFIDTRDVAAAAVKLLSSHQFDKKAFNLTGPESLDHNEIAKLISLASAKTVRYEEITPEDMLQGLLSTGLPSDYAQFLIMILEIFKLGYSETVSLDLEMILGRKGISAEQYTQDFARAWK
jgi:uncharacterized protein YbjT (DUF2867 family)